MSAPLPDTGTPTTEPRYGPQSPKCPPKAMYTRPPLIVSAARCWS
jgi:hypothetical protein